jgi:hypothetical protein
MGMGWSFTFLAAAMIVVPIAGLVWFALDEIFTHGGRPRASGR